MSTTAQDRDYRNRLQTCVAENQVCKSFGIKLSANAQVVQVARHAGFDSLFIDLEHAWLSLAEASNLCNVAHLADITPFVRVPHQCGTGYVQKVLDGGAMGVIFPHVHSADDARKAVACCKYPPQGTRSMTGMMPLFGMRSIALDHAMSFGNEIGSTVFAMIEDGVAVERAEEIAAVEGVDVLLIGSADLTIALGIAGQFDNPKYRSAVETVSRACQKYGKVFGVAGIYNDEKIQDWLINDLTVRFLLAEQDLSLIASGGKKAAAAIPKVR